MWTAYLFQTTSGVVGPKLNFSNLSWKIDLNDAESITLTLPKSNLPSVDLDLWLSPWWAGVVLYWNNTPLVAGPIISRPNETLHELSVDCRGIRSILARRLVINEQSNWDLLRTDSVLYTHKSLGTIAKEVVKLSQLKPSGGLPISYPIPDEIVANDEDHQRTYRSFNLQNISCDQILEKLSNVSNGPDIMFRPRAIQDNQITLDMWYGTDKQPRIAQTEMYSWDSTAVRNEVTNLSIITTGTYQTQRVFSTGAGQDEGTLIAVSFDNMMLNKQYPLLETVVSTSDSENIAVVKAHGDSTLTANKDSLKEIQMTVRGDGSKPFGTFWPGDVCEISIAGFVALADGTHRVRILSMSGNDTSEVKMSLQLD